MVQGRAQADVTGWLDVFLPKGSEIVAPPRLVHDRPWAQVFSVTLRSGTSWLKCNAAAARFEGAVVALLAELLPGEVPDVICRDDERGWFVTADAGQARVPDQDGPDAESRLWEDILAQYGALQHSLSGSAHALLTRGVPDRRPETLTDHLDELVGLLSRQGRHHDLVDRLGTLRPDVDRWCEILQESDAAPSLQHDDLHLGNVMTGDGVGRSRFIDWADSALAHPFGSLLYPLHAARRRGDDNAAVWRLVDAYHQAWGSRPSRRALAVTLDAALRTASIHRALVWRAVSELLPPGAGEAYYGSGAPRWLGRLADGSWSLACTLPHPDPGV